MKQEPRSGRGEKWLFVALLPCIVAVVCGCQTLNFYAQAIRGESRILFHEEPIDRLIADAQTPARLKEQLQLVQQLRAFAQKDLQLPVDRHYCKYVDVHRPYVVWNVQAAPRFSLEPRSWWYPVAGRLEYRGYFSERGARDCARRMEAQDYDVSVNGVEAYSTLGWFKDPVLNTFIYGHEPELAEVIFHELGHQRVFARGDTDFNEAFATTVGQEGARRWLRARGRTTLCDHYLLSLRRNDQFVHLILETRERLEKVYGDTLDKEGKVKAAKRLPAAPEQLRREKQRVFEELRSEYAALKSEWGGYSGYDDWFTGELNNARLNTIANYYDYVPGFERLLRLNGGDLEQFYQAAERLAKMPREERHRRLRQMAAGKGSADFAKGRGFRGE
jgi:predicted aminopeptidase